MPDVDTLRGIPLFAVMKAFGATPDTKDPARNWRTPAGRITVTGEKFHNHDQGKGGGGAIDLAMHLGEMRFKEAIAFLGKEFGNVSTIEQYKKEAETHAKRILDTTKAPKLGIPSPDPSRIKQVFTYLTAKRGISPDIVTQNIKKKNIWADSWGNCCFALRDMQGKLVGAELRGTYEKPYHGGRGQKGLFYSGSASEDKIAVFTETGIDALSYQTIMQEEGNKNIVVVGTMGNQKFKMIEVALEMVSRGYKILAGYDNDKQGNHLSEILQAAVEEANGVYKRECPPNKDWNETLQIKKGIIKEVKKEQTTTSKNREREP